MTGSPLAPIVIPIVAVLALAVWLALVYYADAHPYHQARRARRAPTVTSADSRRESERAAAGQDAAAAITRSDDEATEHHLSEPAQTRPGRRAA